MGTRNRSPRIGWAIVAGGIVSALLIAYVLLQLPAWQWLALAGTLVPLLVGWIIARARPVTRRIDSVADDCRATYEIRGELARLEQDEESLVRQNAFLTALHKTTLEIVGRLDLDDLLQEIVESACRLMDTQHGFLHLSTSFASDEYDSEDLTIDCRVGTGLFRQYEGYHMGAPRGISAAAWETQQTVSVNDYDAWEQRSSDVRSGLLQAVMVAPLKSGDRVVGVIGLAHSAESGRIFRSEEVEILSQFAELAAIALDNSRLFTARERLIADLDAFAHTVAHDLQGSLGVVVGYGELLLNDLRQQNMRGLTRMAASIVRSGNKMSNIIDELMVLASVRRQRVRLGPLDMDRIVSEAEERIRIIVEEHGAKIVRPDTWPDVLGYGPWVEEVWVNYLSNAIKYGGRPDNGTPPHIEIGFDEQTNIGEVRFWVRDNGWGIPSDEHERLFTPFTRLQETRAQGHGLGLSIVKRIVEKLGGKVHVTSTLGEGSTFSFSLLAVPTRLEQGMRLRAAMPAAKY